eukprot:TRINITY_DN49172_c0_g1_i1.p1 TRINITY_DN49172_c0_g1~~TRINITY_DN49172_c0_g1_i1.p1  ORF type:complete len:191 (+),score=16.26 TRINITY_DN49172_c0_g1_i1:54-626(+)
MSDFDSLVLIIGDFHSPSRKGDVPQCFKELLSTDKINKVICTGNTGCKANLDMLRGIAGEDLKIVAGDTDIGGDFPETAVAKVGDLKIGLLHGHQIIPWGDETALAKFAWKLDVDILVSGHTHKHGVSEVSGKFLLNPGSVTGACNLMGDLHIQPSFMLMAVQGSSVVLYTYEEVGGETKVSMNELKKES